VDVVIVIPTRASDGALMQRARATWLLEEVPNLERRHFFLLSIQDPDRALLDDPPSDVLVLNCSHGYTSLLQKMVIGYRYILDAMDVAWYSC